ncbi:hypothetical protein POSPLADRAFT_1137958 [Postia placenta MAD-698-R-SB12]|uniref:AB hydrolase-1 domain-containing protein n=1 Tax=Postia placenta MAD-698-R-SB12 TaxID=670580 RepID=A0A1X6N6P5_9APHY|nr:hypothetical protein POSPLADRAFT_1137958 [Postia placenta MAD-698-R-SB12]OSX64319.1 hypothetical protein POSPLADRAFT_1137958 [Postia placenta MAD-698-R-SB12]
MPHALLTVAGVQFSYEDSGAPVGSTSYVTLVLAHGAVFHAPIFRRMFQYAAENNMRLVAVTLRDYPGSTPFTVAEHAALRSPDSTVQASMIRDRGFELAEFLAWFIRTENIPPMSFSSSYDDGCGDVAGGMAILGWSWGNCMTLSMLAHAGSLPTELQDFLNPYMRTLFVYDPPHFVFGAPNPTLEELYVPQRDPRVPANAVSELFTNWVSRYYLHSDTVLGNLPALSRAELFSGIAQDAADSLSPDTQLSIQRMSAAEIDVVADFSVMQRSHIAMMDVDLSVYHGNARRALLDKTTWPRLRVVHVWCDRSPGEIVYAAWFAHKMMMESVSTEGRRVVFKQMERANHFPHWDQPEVTVRMLAKLT